MMMSVSLPTFVSDTLRPADLCAVDVPGLYVHVPFCFHKCHYCDFYSITRQGEDRMALFVDLILAEADLWSVEQAGPTPRPRTVFFGGGTPSLLPLPLMEKLIRGLRARVDFSTLEEWTIECNPATVSLEYLQMLRATGVDRLSFGAQSFDRAELATLERHHDPEDVPRSLDLARAAGFERLNLDLIYAIPGQSLQSWQRSLEMAFDLGTTHLSCYGLTYESNTPMTVRKRLGHFQAVEESVELEMFHFTRNRLAGAGLPAYEVSNYAAPGQECRHNLLYWHGEDYIGFGPSGASHVAGVRWKNRGHLGEWEQAVGAGDLPTRDTERLHPRQRAGELAMLALRLSEGLRYDAFERCTGFDARTLFAGQIDQLTKVGLIEPTPDGFHLTPRGWELADGVAGEFVEAGE